MSSASSPWRPSWSVRSSRKNSVKLCIGIRTRLILSDKSNFHCTSVQRDSCFTFLSNFHNVCFSSRASWDTDLFHGNQLSRDVPSFIGNLIFKLLKTKRRLLCLKTQFVPRSKHFSSRILTPVPCIYIIFNSTNDCTILILLLHIITYYLLLHVSTLIRHLQGAFCA